MHGIAEEINQAKVQMSLLTYTTAITTIAILTVQGGVRVPHRLMV